MSIAKTNLLPQAKEKCFGFYTEAFSYWKNSSSKRRILPIITSFTHRARLIKDAFYEHGYSSSSNFEIITSGSMNVHIKGKIYNVKAGELFILPVGTSDYLECGPEGYCTKFCFGITGSIAEATLSSLRLKPEQVIPLNNLDKIEAIFDQIATVLARSNKEDLALLYGLTHQILFETSLQKEAILDYPLPLYQAITMINANLKNGIKINDITDNLNIPRKSLFLYFKKYLNTSPKEYITDLRMKKASVLLTNRTLNVKEIAYECGYSSYEVFARQFKDYFQKTPLDYSKTKN